MNVLRRGGMSTYWCPNCDREVEVVKTVPWQPDVCSNCGADAEALEA
jgi:DNA-directed RNA polymerase subunit RPC12/RpoP